MTEEQNRKIIRNLKIATFFVVISIVLQVIAFLMR